MSTHVQNGTTEVPRYESNSFRVEASIVVEGIESAEALKVALDAALSQYGEPARLYPVTKIRDVTG